MFKFLKKKNKNFKAIINSSMYQIDVKSGQNLLSAALLQGIPWPHKCRVGSCGTCKCIVLKGTIKPEIDFANVLNAEQLKAGYVLACKTALKSDIEVIVKIIK
jgi:xylene monooxygenase electron transfer component